MCWICSVAKLWPRTYKKITSQKSVGDWAGTRQTLQTFLRTLDFLRRALAGDSEQTRKVNLNLPTVMAFVNHGCVSKCAKLRNIKLPDLHGLTAQLKVRTQ